MSYDPYPWYAEQTRERFTFAGSVFVTEYELDITIRHGIRFEVFPN